MRTSGDADGPAMVQLLAPDGTLREHATYTPLADTAMRVDMLARMIEARRLDSELTSLQRQNELAMWIPLSGQEAAQVGSVLAFGEADHLFPSYREHAVMRARGVPYAELLSFFRGTSHGGWDPARHGAHLYTVVLGTQVLHAVGYAMGIRLDGAEACVGVYFGDGATSQGDVSEALGWAAVHAAPVVFLCQNNQWAISTPVARQSAAPLVRRADGFGMPGVQVDGNDVLAVHAVTTRLACAARSGQGPSFVEALTYRLGPHTTADDPTRYRDSAELESWRARDPIERLRRHLLASGALSDADVVAMQEQAADVAADVRHAVQTMPAPEHAAMFDHAYAAAHPLIEEQRAWLEGYRLSFSLP